ncbi:non-ribosomal peptide synthetase [Streptomyces antarcticus]|uniref:non-ribosomal peptide synthetase n=1 Tax=Streptomyces antarcticus TaxID=2996458 RepID=UPI00226F7E1A|nr:non-ribosomal peptide synthetase [Streptomyces sp. H34-AA3]MCY0941350.1 amino acid adenylation domain-containing protein [Streptomyces sp. H34-AA3]
MTGTDTEAAGPDARRAEFLRRRLAGEAGGRRSTVPRADRGRPLPLSSGQRQMWFLTRLEPQSPEYLVPVALRLRGVLDRPALERSWQRLLSRHEILRTRYAMDGPEPVQIIDAFPGGTGRAVLPVEDLSHLPAGDRDSEAHRRLEREGARPIDLEREWPVRGLLLRCADDDHVLIMVVHHIACDAWSTQLFAEEIATGYRAAASDGAGKGQAGAAAAAAAVAVDPDPGPQYADYAAWEREQAATGALRRHVDHWRAHLSDLTPLDLPADRRRPAVRGHDGDAVTRHLPAGPARALRTLAGSLSTTPFTVLLAGYQALLSRYTGSSDIPVGTIVSGRGRPELQRMIGYCINSLVLRGRWDGDPPFAELVDQARTILLDAFDHQAVPFPLLVAELEPERDRSRTPLFQTLFTLRERTVSDYELPGIRMEHVEPARPKARFDLALVAEEDTDGGYGLRLEYATELFDRSTAERILTHFVRLLTAAVRAPGTRLSALELLDAAEYAALTAVPAPQPADPRTVPELFGAQAGRTPDATALVAGPHRLTYAELDARANRIAHHLAGLGVGPESRVGVCLERGIELLPALLGVLKTGGAYVPLDPTLPDGRLDFILRDAGVTTIVTQSAHTERWAPLHGGGLVVLDDADDRRAIAARPATGPAPHPSSGPDSLVYVIHTSGSTGRPKGVALTHGNVVRLLDTARPHLGFGADDVWSMCHSYAFDVSVFEMWGALLHGGTLVVVPAEVTRSPDDLVDLLVSERVTVLSQTPSAFRGLVAAAAAGDPRLRELVLRTVVFAGERLDIPELAPWARVMGLDAPRLVNMYGITETTVHSTVHQVTGADLAPRSGNPIGRPLGDLALHLLDAHGRPVPAGVRGEIHVGGPGVARGYLDRPGLTAEWFVPDPFGPPGSRLYRSGDLARRRGDGDLEFLGRADDQVKVRGYRIEPGEVTEALTALDSVQDAVVTVRSGQLVAHVVPVAGAAAGGSELRAALGLTLPAYMVPAHVVTMEALPLTANGKVDRAALPGVGSGSAEERLVAPRTGTEKRVAEVWAEVLGLARVGVEDGFFDLGGDSIRAVALVGAVRAAGYDVSVRDVFASRTVAALAELATSRPAAAATRAVAPFELIGDADRAKLPSGLSDAYPMAQTQIGMIVEMLADRELHRYHGVTSFRVRDDEPFVEAALIAAARGAVERHEVLRSSFDLSTFSVPMQLVHAEADVPVEVTDLRGLAPDELRERLKEFQARERADVFDVTRAPMLRVRAHLADDGWWLTMVRCHAITEGWSNYNLLMELLDGYRALREGAEPQRPEPPEVRYADFVAGELRALESPQDRAYWTDVIERHRRQYRSVLEAMLANPDADADAVPLPDGDREVLARLDRGDAAPRGALLPGLFARQAARTPHAVAVLGGAGRMSYAELDALSDRVAHRLLAAGAGPESVVGVVLDRGAELVACLLGVWKAGAAYLPVDPAQPAERIRNLLADADTRMILTRRESAPAAVLERGGTLLLDDGFPEGAPSTLPGPVADPGRLACVIYTSGSTGLPKGVQITHGGLAARVGWTVREHGLGPDDRVLQKTSIGFDAAGWELFAPLVSGGAVVPAPPGAEGDPAAMLRSVVDHRVTVLQAVPSVWRLLADAPDWERCTSLRLLFSAGEPLDTGLARRLSARAGEPAPALWNTYGPTECTIDVAAHRVAREGADGPVPIGRPLPGAALQVLDARMRPVPVGVTGELYAGGTGVARGYLGRPDLTAGQFVPDPGGPPGSRLYRTGDLARVRPDGNLVFEGRADDQVKVNGVRIEPAEITGALLAQPGVRAAAVVPRQTDDGGKRLVAYVVAAGPGPLDPAELRRRLATDLPAVMVPADFVTLDRLPLTASGKLDRRALPAPGPASGAAYVEPSTPAERALGEIYRSVLKRERVGARDSFFDYGADSLLIIKVIAAARRRGIPLTLRMLYEYDTLAALAAAAEALMDGTEALDMPVEEKPATAGAVAPGGAREVRVAREEMLDAMRRAHVPGVALAVLRDGELVSAEGYGVIAADRPEPVTARTPFQVASVSKHVTVLAVLRLVSEGVLNLDADINRVLTSWQVPGSSGITLRELLSHQAGLSHVRPTNFLPTERMPAVLDVLTGRPPATNEPVRAEHPAGSRFRKTNINYSVLETLLQDVTGEPFGEMMSRLVLDPLEMADSSFDQACPHRSKVPVAIGHDTEGAPIAGRWRIRNEVAAGGLWASATDLAKAAREIRRAHLGESGTLITRPLAQQMLSVWHPGSFYGLGTVLDDTGGDTEFGHGGRTVGFRVATFTRVDSGEGLIVLANAESGRQIQAFVADAARRSDGRVLTGRMSGQWLSAPDTPVEAPEGAVSDHPVRRAGVAGSDADE